MTGTTNEQPTTAGAVVHGKLVRRIMRSEVGAKCRIHTYTQHDERKNDDRNKERTPSLSEFVNGVETTSRSLKCEVTARRTVTVVVERLRHKSPCLPLAG